MVTFPRHLSPIIIWLSIFVLFVLVGAAVINGYILWYAHPYLVSSVDDERVQHFDAGLLLWASVYADWTLSPVLQERADWAIRLVREGIVSWLLVSWDGVEDDRYKETPALYRYVSERIPPERLVLVDPAWITTYDSIWRAKELYWIERVLIFTQWYHLSRSVYIARKLWVDAWGYVVDQGVGNERGVFVPREFAARIKAWFDVELWHSHAKYGTLLRGH